MGLRRYIPLRPENEPSTPPVFCGSHKQHPAHAWDEMPQEFVYRPLAGEVQPETEITFVRHWCRGYGLLAGHL